MAVAYDNIIYNSVMDEIERVLLEVRDEIRAKMASEGVNASGRTSAGIQVQRYESGVRLVLTGDDVAPLATLEVGRRGGKVPMGFSDIIEQWSRDKGLSFPRDRDRRRFAYFTICLTSGEVEALRGKTAYLRAHSKRWPSQDLNPGCVRGSQCW